VINGVPGREAKRKKKRNRSIKNNAWKVREKESGFENFVRIPLKSDFTLLGRRKNTLDPWWRNHARRDKTFENHPNT
jgi:hypothetical protein